MDQSLKQRLVGAVVLISLAVLFLPLVFDGQQERINIDHYDIPDKPVLTIESPDLQPIAEQAKDVIDTMENIDKAKQAQAEKSDTMAITNQLDLPEHSEPNVELPPSSHQAVQEHVAAEREVDKKVKEQGKEADLALADAWVIQVGAFSSQENANKLRDRLNKSGYSAYTKAASGLYKVYVGPEIRKYRLEQQKAKLEKQFSLKTMILKYIP